MARYTVRNEAGRRVRIEFATGNAAFEDNPNERRRLVRVAMARNENGDREGRLMDFNGNTVGGFREIRG
jgi:hypothetical protein